MAYGITRERAVALLEKHLKEPHLRKHALASEAVMRRLAHRLHEDEEKWGLAGLLHDLDAEETAGDMKRHTHRTEEILHREGVDEEIVRAIVMHNEAAREKRRGTPFEHALAAAETITGLIVATALVYPDKKLASVKARSVRKRMKEKAFAAGVDREIIRECEKLGISLDEFIDLSLEAMQRIAQQLDL